MSGQETDLRTMALDRGTLIAHLRRQMVDRLALQEEEIRSTRASFANDTKSSAGDKHEVGRAMVQQELDKLEEQRVKLVALLQELERVPVDRTYDRVAFGSLVKTDEGCYFIAVGLGAIELDGDRLFAISLASPIGQVLKGKTVGDHVAFNGRSLTIEAIA
jgi:transcription elongation GreA/GreB family factor